MSTANLCDVWNNTIFIQHVIGRRKTWYRFWTHIRYKMSYHNWWAVESLLWDVFWPGLTHWGRDKMAGDIFKSVFLNENVWISINISLKFVPKGSINNITALFQIMAWYRPRAKPLSEPMMDSLLTHICVTRPEWVQVCHYRSIFDWVYNSGVTWASWRLKSLLIGQFV